MRVIVLANAATSFFFHAGPSFLQYLQLLCKHGIPESWRMINIHDRVEARNKLSIIQDIGQSNFLWSTAIALAIALANAPSWFFGDFYSSLQ